MTTREERKQIKAIMNTLKNTKVICELSEKEHREKGNECDSAYYSGLITAYNFSLELIRKLKT